MIPGKVCKVENWQNVPWSLEKYVQWETGKMFYDPWQSMYSEKLGKCPMIPGKVCTVGNWENVL